LGLAADIQKKRRGYIIVPILTPSRLTQFPSEFATRDFYSKLPNGTFPLENIQGIDQHARLPIEMDRNLVASMQPQLLVSRLDFFHESTFKETRALDLYEDLFPPIERDDREDIIRWVLRDDIGEVRRFKLSSDINLDYKLDSRYFIMTLAGDAVGIAFTTYDYRYHFLYGNYIAVEQQWRNFHGLGDSFLDKIEEICCPPIRDCDDKEVTDENRANNIKQMIPLYNECKGVVFEVETFKKSEIERIISELEQSRKGVIEDPKDLKQMRRFLRVTWYQKKGFRFFMDREHREPLVCVGPCLYPNERFPEKWKDEEESYWLMWQQRRGTIQDFTAFRELWEQAVKSVYLEILAKSLVEDCPGVGLEYWEYVNRIVETTLAASANRTIILERFLHRDDSNLLKRWRDLGIHLPI
jgi:hypothetical protein